MGRMREKLFGSRTEDGNHFSRVRDYSVCRINGRRNVAWYIDSVQSVEWRIKGGRGLENKRREESRRRRGVTLFAISA